jgi:hypothetical protein
MIDVVYVDSKRDIMSSILESVRPFPVMSLDHTFNVAKRTVLEQFDMRVFNIAQGYVLRRK